MHWIIRLPSYRKAAFERALGMLAFSYEQGAFILNSPEVKQHVKTMCVHGMTSDFCALTLVKSVLKNTIERDMDIADAERVLLALLTWPDHSAREHYDFREQVLRGDLGPDIIVSRFKWVSSCVGGVEAQGGITAEEANSFDEDILQMLADRIPDKVELRRKIHERKNDLVG